VRVDGFNEYQLVAKSTAIYPGAGDGGLEALTYLGLGLGEAGEIQGKLKKVLRDSDGKISEETKAALVAELGDLLWYIANMANELRVPLNEVATGNLSKLLSRKRRGVIRGSGDDR
jgi:NTP pyrophosphatase (non-canonical NTP hydrolase)